MWDTNPGLWDPLSNVSPHRRKIAKSFWRQFPFLVEVRSELVIVIPWKRETQTRRERDSKLDTEREGGERKRDRARVKRRGRERGERERLGSNLPHLHRAWLSTSTYLHEALRCPRGDSMREKEREREREIGREREGVNKRLIGPHRIWSSWRKTLLFKGESVAEFTERKRKKVREKERERVCVTNSFLSGKKREKFFFPWEQLRKFEKTRLMQIERTSRISFRFSNSTLIGSNWIESKLVADQLNYKLEISLCQVSTQR